MTKPTEDEGYEIHVKTVFISDISHNNILLHQGKHLKDYKDRYNL